MKPRSEQGVTLVELLIVMLIFGIVTTAVTGVLISTQRSESFQSEMQSVMDDGRLSIENIRREIRAARIVFASSCEGTPPADTADAAAIAACLPSSRLHFWVDQNQDAVQDASEIICYATQELAPVGSGQYTLRRWTGDVSGCSTVPSTSTLLAQTLVDPQPFVDLDPIPTVDPTDIATNDVRILLNLEVLAGRGPDSVQFESIIRLRNVA